MLQHATTRLEICCNMSNTRLEICCNLLKYINYSKGLVYYEIVDTTEKAVKADRFDKFMKVLCEVAPVDAIFIMDNASIHKQSNLEEIVGKKAQKLLWQSAYSPDYNPIENVFGWTKGKLKDHEYSSDTLLTILKDILHSLPKKIIRSFVNHCKRLWDDDYSIHNQLSINY